MNIDKLPKWAQEHIENIERERGVAVRALNKYVDGQTPSPISVMEMECTGEGGKPSFKTRYIQGHRISINHEGVELNIILRDGQIDLSWGGPSPLTDVALIPSSYQQAGLVSKKFMR